MFALLNNPHPCSARCGNEVEHVVSRVREALRSLVQSWAFCPGPPKPSRPPEASCPSGSLGISFLPSWVLAGLGLIYPTGSPDALRLLPSPLKPTSSSLSPLITHCRSSGSSGDCVGEDEQTTPTPDIPGLHGFVQEAGTIFRAATMNPTFFVHILFSSYQTKTVMLFGEVSNKECPL